MPRVLVIACLLLTFILNGIIGNASVAHASGYTTTAMVGFSFGCYAKNGGMWCWGNESNGQLGNGSFERSNQPLQRVRKDASTTLDDVTGFTLGGSHACAISLGNVWCWGYNLNGELGSGVATTDAPYGILYAVQTVKGDSTPLTGVTSVASYANSTCAIASGDVWCWGVNAYGQLGNNSTDSSASAVQVQKADASFLTGATSISMSEIHGCAVAGADGEVWCWGNNQAGALGNGTNDNSLAAIRVVFADGTPLTGATAVAASLASTCAIIKKSVYCWGNNSYGELGLGYASGRQLHPALPVQERSRSVLSGVTQIMGGEGYFCALSSRMAWCWGDNSGAKLGTYDDYGQTRGIAKPVLREADESALKNVTSLSVGRRTACAIASSALWCWGYNEYGQMGNGYLYGSWLAIQSGIDSSATMNTSTHVSSGAQHSCAVRANKVLCWGDNSSGQLGNGTNTTSDVTVAAPVLWSQNATAVTTGDAHSCALSSGSVWCWGSNQHGQLGDLSVTNRTTPVRVVQANGSALTGITAISAGAFHTCAMSSTVFYCWGENAFGQLGDGSTVDRLGAVQVKRADNRPFTGLKAISAGAYHSCAVSANQAWCWGRNVRGQLGDLTTRNRTGAVQVKRTNNTVLGSVTAVATGEFHSCAIAGGASWCWGENSAGELGDRTYVDRTGAVQSVKSDGSALSGLTLITAGATHTCGVIGGEAWCWGDNSLGQLGDATGSAVRGAVNVKKSDGSAFTTVTAIASGDQHTCAVSGGSSWCWGMNGVGQLGINTYTPSTGATQTLRLAYINFR